MTLRRAALLVLPVLLVSSLYAAPAEVQRSGPHIYLQESHSAPVAAAEKTLAGRSAEPLAVASADLNGDGAPELISTYATRDGGTIVVRRGNIDAFAPRGDAALRAIAEARFPAPFAGDATTVDVPVRPDFVVTGNFTGNASLDLAVASRASDEIYVFAGDGRGGFASPKGIRLAGPVTSLAAGDLERTGGYTNLVAGVSRSRNSSSLIIERGGEEGLEQVKEIFFNGAISALAVGDLDGDLRNDVAVLEGGHVSIVQSSTMQARSVTLPVSAVAMAIGAFVHDRDPRLQIALLSADGSIHIAARNGFDPRAFTADELAQMRRNRGRANALPRNASAAVLGGWQIIESFAGVAKFTDGLVPILLRTRISSRAADDVMVLNRAAGEMTLISHPNLATGAKSLIKGEVSKQPYSRTTVAAVPARVNIDGRPGVVTIEKGETTPRLMMPLPDPTFTVNTTADTITPGACAAATPGACSLREAVIEANAAAGVDTIIVPAGTYTLTIPNVPTAADGENGALTGDLDILDGVNIVGAGSATTIVQAGLTAGTGIDKVFSINPNFTTAFATTLSGMTIRFGKNTASFATDGFGGAFDWEASGTGTLNVTDVIVDQNTTADGDGGGITLTNAVGGPGAATFSNVTVSNNTVQESSTGGAGIGGGIFIGTTTPVTLSNSTISTNHADQVAATSGQGGGIFLFGPDGATQSACHACTISGNTAAGDGGGILSGQSLTIDQLSSITGNTSGNNGGGLWLNHPGVTTTITKSTIAGNTATVAGGGIRVDTAATTALDMTFSRLAGNTAPTGNNLSNAAGTVNAPDNWWGTNVPAPTISGTVVFDPFIVLTHTASPTTLKVGDSSTLTADFLHDNHNAAIALANIPVLIGLPITFDNATNGTISAADTNIQSTGTANATFTATTPGTDNLTAVVDQGTAVATVVILAPPTIVKAFGAGSVPLSGSTSLTFTISNPNAANALSGIGFTDTLPAGLLISTPSGLTSTCGGTATATAGTSSVTLTGGTLAASGTCTVSLNVTGTATGTQLNTTGNVTSTEAGNGGVASASVVVEAPPSIAKVFGASTIALNATTSLTFTITNPAANVNPLTGVAFTDTLPTGLTVASASATVCGGTLTTTAPTGIALTGATIAVSSQCVFSVTVTGAAGGQFTNTTGNVTSTNGGTGNTATANLTVTSPPTITKNFGAASIPLNGTTSLTLTINNPNTTVALTGIAFTDSLPAGLTVAPTPNLSNTCGGTATAVGGSGSVSLSNGTLAASATCTVSLDVQGTTAGVKNNSVQVTSTEGGTGNTSNASITVVGPPVIIKSFGAASIPLNGSTSLTFTIQNNNTTTTLTGVGFSDTLPAGLVVSTPNGLTGSCGGGTITATAGTNTISLSGASIAASSTCTFAANITGIAAGLQNNTTGNVTSAEGGTGGTASASVVVEAPPSIAKVFNPSSISQNATTSLTFTITNPAANPNTLNGVAFTDTLPTGLTVANASATVCGGTLTTTAPTGIALAGATIAVNSQCQFSITVTGAASGQFINTSGNVTSTNGGTGNTATANLTVGTFPTVAKAFGAASIPLGATTSLTLTLTNPNTSLALTGVSVADTLPAGLVVATPSGLASTCGGTTTATAGSGSISLTGGTLAAAGSCTITVNITGTAPGVMSNTTGPISSTETGPGATSNTATILVVAAPSIAKAFGAATIVVGNSTTLSFTITNANTTTAMTGIAFTDTLPSGLVVATPNGLTGTCGGGTITAAASAISLSGATLPASSSCTFSVNVTGTGSGQQVNTTSVVTSTNAGAGNAATATITVQSADLAIAKTHGGAFSQGQTGATFSIDVVNIGASDSSGTVTVTDTLPAGLTATAIAGTGWTCTLATLTCTRSDALASGASFPTITLTVDVSPTAPASVTNTATVAGGGDTDPGNNTATDTVQITAVTGIPMLSPEMLLLLAAMLALVALKMSSK